MLETATTAQETADAPPSATFTVWDGTDPFHRDRWEEEWRAHAGGDVFSHPVYVASLARDGETPRCAAARFPDGGTILYAFIVRSISRDAAGREVDEQWWDMYTPLVYGGPTGHGVGASEIGVFWDTMRDWARRHRIVSEIIRFTPVGRHRLPYPGTAREQAPHIVVDLEGLSDDDIIGRLRKSTRRTYRRALDAGIVPRIDATERGLEQFLSIHAETMARVEASPSFYLDEDFLSALHRAVPDRIAYAFAEQDGRPVSAELMLLRDGSSCAFLGGTRTRDLGSGSTVVASVAALLEARRRGSGEHVLTGGVTNQVDDALLHFKRGFTRDGDRSYFTGEQVFLPEIYEQLSTPDGANLPKTTFFPAYRAPAPSVPTS